MKYNDYDDTLELEPGCSAADIRKAYRRLARRYHPDVSKEPEAEARFKQVSEADQTLSDLRWSGFSGQPPSLASEAGHHP